MKLHVFQSSKGDCLVLEASDRTCMLVDGGMSSTMKSHVRHALPDLLEGRPLEAVYVSHIDQDHISGVLQLLKDALEWKVYDYHATNGEGTEPDFPRPPEIHNIWHNAFRDQIGKNSGAVEDLLAAAAPALLATSDPDAIMVGEELLNIAQSIPEVLEVSQLASADLLNIPTNQIPGAEDAAGLMMIRPKQRAFAFGSMELTIVGPTQAELTQLRNGWDNWLRLKKPAVRELRAKLKERIEEFSSAAILSSPFDLGDWNGIPNYEDVTAPNVASLMFMVEEDGKRLLLTGDSQQDIILKGLRQTGFLEQDAIHLDILKVQHHGSEHNADARFCRTVSADHYVFCGNGSSGNPELSVLKLFFNSRCGKASERAKAPEAADRPFVFWFSTDSAFEGAKPQERAHMRKVKDLVEGLVEKSGGLLTARFNVDAYQTIDLG